MFYEKVAFIYISAGATFRCRPDENRGRPSDGVPALMMQPSLRYMSQSIVWTSMRCSRIGALRPFGEEIPFYQLINVGGYKVLITHGHLFSVKHTRVEICQEASRLGADIVLFGHTHAPSLEYIEKGTIYGVERDLTLFNPGALSAYDGSFGNLSLSDNGFLLSHGRFSNITKK